MFVRLRAIARQLHRAREWFPLTNLGLVVLGVAGIAYWGFGVPRTDYVVLLVSALTMVLVLVGFIGVSIGAILVYRNTRAPPGEAVHFEAHRGFADAFSLPTWPWLPIFEVAWTWIRPEGFHVELIRQRHRLHERVSTARRGTIDGVVRRLVIEDAFGLARLVLHRAEARTIRVLPFRGALDRAPLLRSLAAGDAIPHPEGETVGDAVDMRRYAPGDPLKLAMWKVYARTQQLMVRTPERAVAPSSQVAAYLVSAVGDEPAAAAAKIALESGALGPDWTFGADGATGAADDVQSATEMILASRAHRNQSSGQGAGLATFVERAANADTIRLVVFVPGRPGPWLQHVADVVRGRAERTSCLVVVDGIRADESRDPRWNRWLKRPEMPKDEEEAWVMPEELSEVGRVLSAAGVQLSAVDRLRGRELAIGSVSRPVERSRRVA